MVSHRGCSILIKERRMKNFRTGLKGRTTHRVLLLSLTAFLVALGIRTRWFVRPLRPVLKFFILLSFMRIEHPLCDTIGRWKRKSVTPQFAECNSFVTLWTVG